MKLVLTDDDDNVLAILNDNDKRFRLSDLNMITVESKTLTDKQTDRVEELIIALCKVHLKKHVHKDESKPDAEEVLH